MKSGLSYSKSEFNQVLGILDESIGRVEEAIKFTLKTVVGGKAVAHAKSYGNFTDRTGNLRSSIGYVLAKDGDIIDVGGFESISGPEGNNGEGISEGKKYAEELGKSSGSGYTLIIVAGMNYAEYVEAKGYNVLTETELYLVSQINDVIDRILKQAGFKK